MDDAEAFEEVPGTISIPQEMPEDWRVAQSLLTLRAQVDAACPNRNRDSDGTIGDAAHCPGPSDHCPNIRHDGVGIVTALDLTHDPEVGCDMGRLMAALVAARDRRIKYLIYDRRIVSSYPVDDQPAWIWRPYSGSNPHARHAHISVLAEVALFDDDALWSIGALGLSRSHVRPGI
ncbi:hypothetical protein [Thalassococcus sp. S3]|uniref:hypothetical protein n=1 Tax=Thalassococcus sp. S3 TaxID=2017482 RepID=UPI001582B88D|nr:hypothetical protein [Thalassococcus sp. S3]